MDGSAALAPVTAAPEPARADAGDPPAVVPPAYRAWRAGAVAVLAYLAVRAVGLVVLGVWAGRRDVGLFDLLAGRSDAAWYLGIAKDGYDSGAGQSDLAFFPLYPRLISLVAQAVGWDGYPGLVVSWTAAVVAAAGLFAVGHALHGSRTGIVLAALWGAVPHAVVENLGYSESLFTALAAWCLYALIRRHWLTAGLLCALAGLTRPSGMVLVPVIALDAVLTLVRGPRGWRPVVAVLMAPLGGGGYLAWVARRTGRLDGWSRVQRDGWHSTWDYGRDSLAQLGKVLSSDQPLALYLATGTVLVAILLLALGAVDRQAWQLWTFALLSVVLTVGSAGYYHAKARFLLPAFPLLLVAARPLGRAGAARQVLVVAALAAVSAWTGCYLLFIWTWSP